MESATKTYNHVLPILFLLRPSTAIIHIDTYQIVETQKTDDFPRFLLEQYSEDKCYEIITAY